MTDNQTSPVALPRVLAMWQQCQDETPVLTLRCGVLDAGRPCRRLLGKVWATAGGVVVWSKMDRPRTQAAVDYDPTISDALLMESIESGDMDGFDGFDLEGGTARLQRMADDAGWLDLADDAEYWHTPTVGCSRHGVAELDRIRTLDAAIAAARTGRPATLEVAVTLC